MEWNVAQEQQQQRRTVSQQQHVDSVWSKPPAGRYKCNVDASFSIRRNRTWIGICIRDDQGSFVLAKTEWFSPILDINTEEAVGLLHALKWVQELQLENVDFELDSKNVVAKFHSKARDISGLGYVIKDCQYIHNSHFRNSRVEFVRRQANEAAHVLANVASSLASFHIFIDVPSCIDFIIANEMS
ncbi:uncharacterized protein LOC123915155 [Trifolium pratense]|uniref:uncharacterized protein LOC123915155 n=1 Tax=Trifolium pratense TaxID=57577 RepID=UPI001E69336B|nr:uncharacterized protein LOC123915155 [Trifolium pratense]